MEKERFEYFAKEIFYAALEVHKTLGPGLLESVYEYALAKELHLRNIGTKYQVKVPLFYKGYETGKEFFLDMLIENEIVVEVKSREDGMKPVHQAHLKLTEKKLGFLINFNVVLLKNGFKRLVNNYFT